MKTEDILNLDFREEKNQRIIQKALRKIKPLAKYDLSTDIPLLTLELLVVKYEKKYPLTVSYIQPTLIPGELNCYKAFVKNTNNFELIKVIYGISLYELFCKLNIYFYYLTTHGKV